MWEALFLPDAVQLFALPRVAIDRILTFGDSSLASGRKDVVFNFLRNVASELVGTYAWRC